MRKRNSFQYQIRTQFSFIASKGTLAQVLSQIAGKNVNLTGVFQTSLQLNNLVGLVPGSPDHELKQDLYTVREVLSSQHVRFNEEKVIQILQITPGTPGVVSSINNALLGKVKIRALYLGEETRIFLSVSSLKKAVEILSAL